VRLPPVLVAAVSACGLAGALHAGGALEGLEQDARVLRFAERPERQAPDVAVIAIDGESLSEVRSSWPIPRRRHAEAIDRLRELGARTIVYDVQFTEPTRERDDLALFDAVQRAGNVVLATTEADDGRTNVLGGDANVREARGVVGAGNFQTDRSDVIERMRLDAIGLPTLAVAAARRAGAPVDRAAFDADGSAWIAFPGPPGTIDTFRFIDLLRGQVPAEAVRGRVVVVGVTAATEQDVHPVPASRDRLMAGVEIQAAAIQTALDGLPLRSPPWWADLLAVLGLTLVPVLAARRFGVAGAVVSAGLAAGAWSAAALVLFRRDLVVAAAAPVAGALLGAGAGIAASWAVERAARRARTADLHAAQLELVARLAKAAESRDEDTGEHIERIGSMARRLALAIGVPAEEAEQLGHAAALHDVGKIAIPDAVLLKPGKLDAQEWEIMRSHAELGAEVLAGSASPVLQVAERIARTHHERWDGTGYPNGLAGEAIPLEGRIVAVCDVFDALTSRRPYKEPWPVEEALAELRRGAGSHFDPALVEAFLRHVAPPAPARQAVTA
jgi:HD-GYP domain-containing protein (c-di-GMP phosphodiesterase class II)